MPFAHAESHFPTAGKNAEMRAVMEEYADALREAGARGRLLACAFGPDFPYFTLATRWANLADREEALPAYRQVTSKYGPPLGALSRRTPEPTLLEYLHVPSVASPAKWVVNADISPALGKGGELRTLLLEHVEAAEARGLRGGLMEQVAGPESGNFTRLINFDGLAEIEAWRAGADPNSDYLRTRDALLSRPSRVSIREVLVTFRG